MLKPSLCLRCCQQLLRGWKRGPIAGPNRPLHTSAVLYGQSTESTTSRPRSRNPISNDDVPFPDFQKAFPMARAPVERDKTEMMRLDLSYALRKWSRSPKTISRLESVGVSPPAVKALLQSFVSNTPVFEGWFPKEQDKLWKMGRFFQDMEIDKDLAIDRIYTRRLFFWVKENPSLFPDEVNSKFNAILEAVDYSHPAEWYPKALAMQRKVIMHVGPTNSGKTYNALRALAGARFGVYAGPLRLLAVEIFERFNKGTILPPDADPDAPPGTYRRDCNLMTGEEIRHVSEDAGLSSCTVEMLSSTVMYDVAVIDEIQMLTDAERGGAWTAAVLGTCASELHLCGEESVVPLVQEMLKDTGDEVIVNRYERLTPLVAAESSLKNDLSRIEKGDCVVAFSRSRIFSLKETIEAKTGMRCALAYGKLPPEVRNEQAELFNDPNSKFDVLVGSDAIGMGLNLRIKRIVFESVSKWDGVKERALNPSQIKQIAGRAGRFGLHDADTSGVVVSLKESDMNLIRKALITNIKAKNQRAVLPRRIEQHAMVERLISTPASFTTVFELQSYLAQHEPLYIMSELKSGVLAAKFIDHICESLTLEERMTVFNSPVQWRDTALCEAMNKFMRMYWDDMNVDLEKAMEELGQMEALILVENMRDDGRSKDGHPMQHLQSLEYLYRVLVVYKWFHHRFPVAFHQVNFADSLKARTEAAIEWTLEQIRAKRVQKDQAKNQAKLPSGQESGEVQDSPSPPSSSSKNFDTD